MLLLYQVGSVKTGEVVRYTVTYVPSQDRILPSPERLHLRVRNSSAIALRAAFVHGPYTLSVAAYPAHFDPNVRFDQPERYGVPEFEPMVKAGGSWECELVVPDDIRQSAGMGPHGGFGKGPEHDDESASWIIEVASQVIFSTSAAVGYEVMVARDRKSLSLGSGSSAVIGGQAQVPQPGRVSDFQQSIGAKDGHHPAQHRGVFSRAVRLKVEDTATLWNTPRLPGWDDAGASRAQRHPGPDQPVESLVKTGDPETRQEPPPRKQKNVHLVILTHGLHSNLGADMLFMKESIDAGVRQAKAEAKKRRARERAARRREETGTDSFDKEESTSLQEEEDSEDEEVIVRGYSGNATKTEKGIKYLGKRLARYVLSTTYPDQPYLPTPKGATESILHSVMGDKNGDADLKPAHKHSSIHVDDSKEHLEKHQRPFKITSISFIAHSLGGPVQTYAIAYIQKHSPDFFDRIKPINFIAIASPFLGLSNENPLYVKFALDFGLVGRTGQDLGLTWRAPTIARSSWGAIVGNLGESAHKRVYGESQPESKPLLRILPTGPAHTALKKFRNRTVYSNVVNDGIVPLRTSCLLFLDWQGLGRVEKARRDAGLVETVVGFGWAELTGGNMSSPRQRTFPSGERRTVSGGTTPRDGHEDMHEVPQPSSTAMIEDDKASLRSITTPYAEDAPSDSSESNNSGPLSNFFNFFKSEPKSELKSEPTPPKNPGAVSNKQKMIFRRSQTINMDELTPGLESVAPPPSPKPSKVTSGHEADGGLEAPPKTTFFESAGDLLNPKMPDVEYLLDPSSRPRTIFHDRVYHPSDIPSPPMKKRPTTLVRKKTPARSSSSQASFASGGSSPYLGVNHEDTLQSVKDYDDTANTSPDRDPNEVVDSSNMRVEEKISRAYHRDLSWRKVLVKLEPEAHNNIFVRRMFANAYGWPVVKHLVDTHFGDSATAQTRTDDQSDGERARDIYQPPDEHGGETTTTTSRSSGSDVAVGRKEEDDDGAPAIRTDSEAREALDKVHDLPLPLPPTPSPRSQKSDDRLRGGSGGDRGDDSMTWSERDWVDSECESDLDFGGELPQSERPHQQQQQHHQQEKDKGKEPNRSASPLSAGWNWAEKIVGKGRNRDEDLRY